MGTVRHRQRQSRLPPRRHVQGDLDRQRPAHDGASTLQTRVVSHLHGNLRKRKKKQIHSASVLRRNLQPSIKTRRSDRIFIVQTRMKICHSLEPVRATVTKKSGICNCLFGSNPAQDVVQRQTITTICNNQKNRTETKLAIKRRCHENNDSTKRKQNKKINALFDMLRPFSQLSLRQTETHAPVRGRTCMGGTLLSLKIDLLKRHHWKLCASVPRGTRPKHEQQRTLVTAPVPTILSQTHSDSALRAG